jgi:phosphoglycolate phosphatase-like HAD superfamily hydrolase
MKRKKATACPLSPDEFEGHAAERFAGRCYRNAEPMFDFACGASLFGKVARYKAVLKRSGIAAADAICIGDAVRDGEAAWRAGTDFGAVWRYAKPKR